MMLGRKTILALTLLAAIIAVLMHTVIDVTEFMRDFTTGVVGGLAIALIVTWFLPRDHNH